MMQYLLRPGGKEKASLKSRQGEGDKKILGMILSNSEQNYIDIFYYFPYAVEDYVYTIEQQYYKEQLQELLLFFLV